MNNGYENRNYLLLILVAPIIMLFVIMGLDIAFRGDDEPIGEGILKEFTFNSSRFLSSHTFIMQDGSIYLLDRDCLNIQIGARYKLYTTSGNGFVYAVKCN